MPIRFIRTNPDLPLEPSERIIPPSTISYHTSVEFFRRVATWSQIMDRSYQEAFEKLKTIVRDDLKADIAPLEKLIPCMVELKEARTQKEEDRIRAAHKRIARVFGMLVDRLVRLRPESRYTAYDSLQQDLLDSKIVWGQYECSKFRVTAEESDGKRAKKKKSSA